MEDAGVKYIPCVLATLPQRKPSADFDVCSRDGSAQDNEPTA